MSRKGRGGTGEQPYDKVHLKRLWFLVAAIVLSTNVAAIAQQTKPSDVHDLTLLVAPELPCVWPVGMTQHLVVPNRTFGASPFCRDLIIIDEHTGTQWDAPAHFIPPPGSGLEGASEMGNITGDKVPVWQFVGEACVIDVSDDIDKAEPGSSFLITPEIVQAWEKAHRPLRFGDTVLFRSGYSDKYYKPFPDGDRFVKSALAVKTPGWPAPTPQCMKYLGDKGVMSAGLDSASMGPLPNLAAATHQAGSAYGMIWTECATNLGVLPATGSAYILCPAKHAGGSGGEARAIGITDAKLAARLIASAREKRVADLSVLLDEEYPITWPGYSPGDEAPRYVAKVLNKFSKARGAYFAQTHMLDSQVGTHVVPPAFSLPPRGFDNASYTADIQAALQNYEAKFGPRGNSNLTTEKIPLNQMMGEAHIVDVSDLISDEAEPWPVITLAAIKEHAQRQAFKPGEIVLFKSGYSDKHFKPFPDQPDTDRMFVQPLAGKAQGWPVPEPAVIEYLAKQGIRCIGTDSPTLASDDLQRTLSTYWLAASRDVLLIEYLTNLDAIPKSGGYFIFAPIKIKGTHGGYGRALAVY